MKDGNSIVRAGDVVTIRDILHGMMLNSSNTCASLMAHYAGAKLPGDEGATAAKA